MGIGAARQVRHQHVDNEQSGADADDGRLYLCRVCVGEGSYLRFAVVVEVANLGQRVGPRVHAGCVDARADRVGQAILRGGDDDFAGRAVGAPATGCRWTWGRQVGDECGLSNRRVSVDDDDLPAGSRGFTARRRARPRRVVVARIVACPVIHFSERASDVHVFTWAILGSNQ